MAYVMDHVEYLSSEIGARTPGTEEERQAALYITDQFQSETGFHTEIEDFVCSSNLDLVKPACAGILVIVSLLALFLPFMAVPAFIIGAICAAIYISEVLGKSFIPQSLARGASQNVVAKYQPNPNQGKNKRSRKIVLVARYDTGKVRPGLAEKIQSLGFPVGLVSIVATALAVILLLFRMLFMANAVGVGALIFNIINIIVLVVVAVPIILMLMSNSGGLNEGANNNATGVAALIEVARRISRGSLSEADIADSQVTMHGEGALYDEGLVPEGALMEYESEQLTPPNLEPQTPEERLAKAKAALAAFTGVPGARWEPSDIASNLVDTRQGFAEPPAYSRDEAFDDRDQTDASQYADEGYEEVVAKLWGGAEDDSEGSVSEEASEVEEAPAFEAAEPAANVMEWSDVAASASKPEEAVEETVDSRFENAPDWFVEAQKKARKNDNEEEIRPSRYGSALAATERDIQQRADEEAAAAAERERERLHEALAELSKKEEEAVAAEKANLEAEVAADLLDDDANVDEQYGDYEEDVLSTSEEPEGEAPESEAPEPAEEEAADGGVAASAPQPIAVASYQPQVEPVVDPEPAPEPAPRKRPIILPSVGGTGEINMHGITPTRQAAPLDDMYGNASSFEDRPSRSGMIRQLRTDIPSLSGIINPIGEEEQQAAPAIGSAGATGSFAPVSDALMAEADDDDLYIDDADDSAFDENYTESGAFAGPDYVEMPKSRFRGLFGRKKKDKNKSTRSSRRSEEQSPQEWLGVDDDFDPREVGKERGGWESFRSDDYDDLPREETRRRNRSDSYSSSMYDDDEYSADFDDDWGDEPPRGGRRWQGGAFSRLRLGRVNMRSSNEGSAEMEEAPYDAPSEGTATDMAPIEQIYHFRNPNFKTEVWFVAIGSETDHHDGIKAFIDEHRSELRGALVMEVESLGAGELAVIQEEGLFKRTTASSRIRRLLKKTAAAIGYEPGQANIPNADTITSVVASAGVQTMHLAGMDGSWPALKGSADDTVENVDEQLLLENIDYITELVQRF